MGMLDGKVAFVTAAGGGIAGAIARRFGAEGASVCCVDVVEETVSATASDIEAAGGKAIAKICDVSDEAAVKRTIDEVAAAFGELNVVVNAAAASEPLHTVATMPLEIWQEVVDVNLTGMFLVAKHAIPHMQGSRRRTVHQYFIHLRRCRLAKSTGLHGDQRRGAAAHALHRAGFRRR